MAFGTVSDPFVATALWAGAGAFAIAAALLLAVAGMRVRLLARLRRGRRLAARWNPLFAECTERVPARVPRIARRDALGFLVLWTRAQESLRGEASARLVELADRAGARPLARALLRSGERGAQRIAIAALGHLRDLTVVPYFEQLVASAPALPALAAAQALLRIHPGRALPRIVAAAARREDWPLATVASILKDADPVQAGRVLAGGIAFEASVPRAGPGLARLLRLHGAAHAGALRPVILRVLERSTDVEALAAALGFLSRPEDAARVRRLTRHREWVVRLAAVQALGRLGTAADGERLVRLLGDESWWVRYRAAQALCALPGSEPGVLDALRERLTDRFAADMLAQVLAERRT